MFRNSHKSLFVVLAILATLSFACIEKASAQTRVTDCSATTQPNAICITHAAVTTRTDGLPTNFPVTYRLEQKFGTGAFTVVSTDALLKHHLQNLAPGDYVWRVFAIESSLVSEASNTASKSLVQAPPNAPVIIIAATIRTNGPPSYRIIQSISLKPNEYVFVAPAKDRPLFANR